MGLCESSVSLQRVSPDSAVRSSTPTTPSSDRRGVLTDEDRRLLTKHFRDTLIAQRADIFHKTMLLCINSSPKLNEIIACQMYCVRDLTKWPKLNRICQAQMTFYDSLIYVDLLAEKQITERVAHMGHVHAAYLQYGFKPHFLDLWQQHFNTHLERLNFGESSEEKLPFLLAFAKLNDAVVTGMQSAYLDTKKSSAKGRDQRQQQQEIGQVAPLSALATNDTHPTSGKVVLM